MSHDPFPLPVRHLAVALVIGSTALVTGCGATSPGPTSGAASPSSSASSPSSPSSASSPTASPSGTQVAPVPVEQNPPGDIADNLAYVRFANGVGGYAFTHPEGWAQTGAGAQVRFTDKLNGVVVDSQRATAAPTLASARATLVPQLQRTVPAFELRQLSAIRLPAGVGVHLVFRRNSDPDPVTGKVYRDEVQEYDVYRSGRLIRMDLFGPVGADNVDAYRTMAQSLSIR